jgi:hypothetical protein
LTTKFTRRTPACAGPREKSCAPCLLITRSSLRTTRPSRRHSFLLALLVITQCYSVVKHRPAGSLPLRP